MNITLFLYKGINGNIRNENNKFRGTILIYYF